MRTFRFLTSTMVVLPLLMSGCTNSPTEPTVNLGKTTLGEFLQNPSYSAWYEPGYRAYPTEDSAAFHHAVNRIADQINAGEGSYKMVMVVKPNCSCQHTQREMPRVMKTLDRARFLHENIEVWITDSPLNGIDEIKDLYRIGVAPTFLLLKDNTELGRIEVEDTTSGVEISTELANIFEQ
ncbi:MAG: hypothetical protein J4G05_05685 [Chlorobi bacterium]|nr:hypothetical protein [Chlorobiota bacterium]